MGKSGIGKGQRAHLRVLREAALHRKVAERLPAGFNGRWTRRHWAHASLFATLGALFPDRGNSSGSTPQTSATNSRAAGSSMLR